jgi:diadenylate cyclase
MEKLLDFIASIRWQDAVDIILNSYIVYRLYALFRGTIVFRVLITIAILWVLLSQVGPFRGSLLPRPY